MKVTKYYETDEERAVLIGMIASDRILAKVTHHAGSERKLFRSKWSNLVAKWCLDHFLKFQRAPRQAIQLLFVQWAERSRDEATVDLVERFLTQLGMDWEGMASELNEDYLIDAAAKLFNSVKIERLRDALDADLEAKNLDGALGRIAKFAPLNLSTSAIVDVLSDEDALRDAIAGEEEEGLIEYSGALGDFFGKYLARDSFVAFMGPEKRGKSFWLIDLAWRAVTRNKRRALYYSVGDMSQRQMMRRFISRSARRPLGGESTIDYPKRLYLVEEEKGRTANVERERKKFESRITTKESKMAMKRIRMTTSSNRSLLKMQCTPCSSTNVMDVRGDIETLVAEGWVPDVIVVDYADILAKEPNADRDFRHQTNETWKALRRLSQEFHCLVVTATQSDARSYDARTMRRGHFSEDKRKLAHVTGMVGINQTEEEKEQDIYRLNWIVLREGRYSESECVYTAACLGIANPAVLSAW